MSGTVRPGDDEYDVSVSGIVTDKPGSYSFNVLLDGAQEGVPTGHRIVLDIPVAVSAISAAAVRPSRNHGFCVENTRVLPCLSNDRTS